MRVWGQTQSLGSCLSPRWTLTSLLTNGFWETTYDRYVKSIPPQLRELEVFFSVNAYRDVVLNISLLCKNVYSYPSLEYMRTLNPKKRLIWYFISTNIFICPSNLYTLVWTMGKKIINHLANLRIQWNCSLNMSKWFSQFSHKSIVIFATNSL